jgi:hypothetical protein
MGALGGRIRSGHQPQGRDDHLAGQTSLHLIVDSALQLNGAQGHAVVEGYDRIRL